MAHCIRSCITQRATASVHLHLDALVCPKARTGWAGWPDTSLQSVNHPDLQVHEKRRNYLHLMLASERCIGAVIEIRHGARVRKYNTWYLKWVEKTSTTGSACTETVYKSVDMTWLCLKGFICLYWVHREFIATWPWQDHSIGHERGVICADGNDANALRKRRPCSPTCQHVSKSLLLPWTSQVPVLQVEVDRWR